ERLVDVSDSKPRGVGVAAKQLIRIAAYKSLVDPLLCLRTQIAVQSSDKNDELVAGIGRLVDQPDVVGGFPTLDVPYNKPTATPCTLLNRIAGQVEGPV